MRPLCICISHFIGFCDPPRHGLWKHHWSHHVVQTGPADSRYRPTTPQYALYQGDDWHLQRETDDWPLPGMSAGHIIGRDQHMHIFFNCLNYKANYIDGLMQDCNICITLAVEILQSCIEPLTYTEKFYLPTLQFLAATKQLYEWFSPSVRLSVCLSVTPFWLCYHHRIILKVSGVITKDQGKVHAKGQGQRSKFKVTEVTTQLNRFRTVTPGWIHIWWWNDAYSLK